MEDYTKALQGKKINRRLYINNYLKIRNKESKIVPFKFNYGQEKLYTAIKELSELNLPVRIVVLKARQIGFSTLTGGVYTAETVLVPNVRTVIVAHEDQSTTNLFEMYKRFVANIPDELRHEEKSNNAKALIFNNKNNTGLDSSITCLTASSESLGASQTIKNLHLSEFGLWKGNAKTMFATIMQCVPSLPNTKVIVESTARGYNHFYELCKEARTNVDPISKCGKNGFRFLFVGWWECEEYRERYTGFELTEKEIELKKKYHLDLDQLEWRRKKIAQIGESLFNQEYPGCPEDAFLTSGSTFFDNQSIANRINNLKEPLYKFDFKYKGGIGKELMVYESKKEINNQGGIWIYEEVKPNEPYVIGADTSGEGSDYFVAQVINNMTGKQVAVMRKQFGEREFVNQLYLLGMYYNEALIGIEVNFSTYPTQILERMEYPKMYVREAVDTYTHNVKKSYGFRTGRGTRQPILDGLKDIVDHEIYLINDYETLAEMLTFVKNEDGRPEASSGNHDDCVMALAITYAIRGQQITGYLENVIEKEEDRLPEWAKEEKSEENEEEYVVWNN